MLFEGFTDVKKKCMLLSQETLLCQDPLENYFGCQRQRGGPHDHPTVHDFQNNTQSLRVVQSLCCGPVRGNCQVSSTNNTSKTTVTSSDCQPLPRRRKHR